jgi:anthranilate/para-aminobenzoate synthase component I
VPIRAAAILQSSDPAQRAWSAHSASPTLIIRCDGFDQRAHLHSPSTRVRSWDDPLDALRWMSEPDAFTEAGRWIGFLGYDLGRGFERLPDHAVDDLKLPLFIFTFHPRAQATAPLRPLITHPSALVTSPLTSTFARERYIEAVEKTIDYIRSGDIFQANLSQRFTLVTSEDPKRIYARLQQQSPAKYAAFLDYGDFALASNSPELFFRITRNPNGSRTISTRPIKGTRPRVPGADLELKNSIKDQAELNMIVDVERNDLGRICRIGSIKVTDPRSIESHPTVYHGVATIEGKLEPQIAFDEILRAIFPTGSVTGAPKIRAMQIIDELEPTRRGPYCGAIGYLDSDGTIEFNVAIRTMIFQNHQVHIPVGGGIVADSDPETEYEETLTKAQAMFRALNIPI